MTTKSTARSLRSIVANNTAPEVVSVIINGKSVSGSRDMILALLAGSEVPATKPATTKAPASKPAVVKAQAPVVAGPVAKSEPVDFVAKAKETECYKAARAATKAAGLAYDAKTNPNGGKYSKDAEVRGAFWTCFWNAFNAKATELGIPVRTRKTAE
jgi:hypothetical protein